MRDVLIDRAPWFVIGPAFGLVVVGLYATLNERIGVVGGFADVVDRIEGRTRSLGWKAWFLLGLVGGALVFSAASGTWRTQSDYGWLGRAITGHWHALIGLPLLGAGFLIGYGAKLAGGCTSGNGLGGCSAGSPGSFVATGTFMGTAIAASFLLRWLVG
jgi:uncharacterized membrane protein YedE/YeeE